MNRWRIPESATLYLIVAASLFAGFGPLLDRDFEMVARSPEGWAVSLVIA